MLNIEAIYLFFFFSVISLASQMYEDFKTLQIDSRRNYYMYGVVITLALITGLNINYLIAVVVVILFSKVLRYVEKKNNKQFLGDGDTEIFNWLIPGTVLLGTGLLYPIVYLVSFGLSLMVMPWFKSFTDEDKLPGTIPISLAFFITLAVYVTVGGITL